MGETVRIRRNLLFCKAPRDKEGAFYRFTKRLGDHMYSSLASFILMTKCRGVEQMDRQRLLFLMEVSILGALSFILDKLTLFHMPQGGSITLSMLPIILMAFRWGLKGGLLTGFLSGILQLITGGTIFHWAQALLDYTLAFTVVGFAATTMVWFVKGMKTRNHKLVINAVVIGSLIGGLLRFLIHFIGGIVFFGNYAPEGQPVWLYSLVYNASYMIPSIILCSVVVILLFTAAPRLLKVHTA